MNEKKVITLSDAILSYERAFRMGNPSEIESLLRNMLNVWIAVVESKDIAEKNLLNGKRLKTISVPYSIFLQKGKGKTIYQLKDNTLVNITSEEIAPNQTYVLLVEEAGYSPEKGLTFENGGQITGYEDLPEAEIREKDTKGLLQKWEEHAKGVWQRSERLIRIYNPFIERWANRVFEIEASKLEELVNAIVWSMQIAAYFHDVGKLNKRWQDIVWQNEKKITGKERNGYIARTSPYNPDLKKNLPKPPPHAPFAYPFIKTFLRKILGDYRFLDVIALATARHHSIEVSGLIEKEEFKWDKQNEERVDKWLIDITKEILGLSDEEANIIEKAIEESLEKVTERAEADEPPSPTDDFYFLYCLTNRLIKICDWEDVSNTNIELR